MWSQHTSPKSVCSIPWNSWFWDRYGCPLLHTCRSSVERPLLTNCRNLHWDNLIRLTMMTWYTWRPTKLWGLVCTKLSRAPRIRKWTKGNQRALHSIHSICVFAGCSSANLVPFCRDCELFGNSNFRHYTLSRIVQVMLDCCNTAPGSCAALKQKYPTFNDNDNSTNPNFCYIHGNVCSRWASAQFKFRRSHVERGLFITHRFASQPFVCSWFQRFVWSRFRQLSCNQQV